MQDVTHFGLDILLVAGALSVVWFRRVP